MASLAAIFPTDHLLSGPPLFGTLSAHRPGHDVAKYAIRRHGLADAGSAKRNILVWTTAIQGLNSWETEKYVGGGKELRLAAASDRVLEVRSHDFH
jgi:hypothetical protein